MGLVAFGLIAGEGLAHSLAHGVPVAGFAVLAAWGRLGRTVRAVLASCGLITASAVLVHLSGGYIELHFHFFVMLPIIALYQEWPPFLLAIGYVALHHGLMGTLAPASVYNHPAAWAHPWRWGVIHAVFVLGASIATVVNWRLLEAAYAATADARAVAETESAERRRAERAEVELTAVVAQLERSNRELQDFAYVASHDLQEPLRKIQAFGDRLKAQSAEALSARGRDYLERMQQAAARMQTLINDLLTFSRVTSQAQPFGPVDLDRVAHEVMADLEVRLEQVAGRVTVEALPVIEADPLQMRQLLQNLLGNALKFHRPEVAPVVTVSGHCGPAPAPGADASATPPPCCQLVMADNGIGFDEQYLDRIFAPFQRLHGRGEYEGTGIGLAVCRKIVERHGGSITARSTPGQGATFIVTLPMTHAKGECTL
jgi:signal transduction histidine kinase